METLSTRPQLRVLLDHLATIKDTRQSWKVAYPLREVLFLVVCGTIASGDDYEDIADWGEAHLSFLRRFSEFYHGIPCADWLRTVMNRIDPELFAACFSSWVAECWPGRPDLVAIDGRTSRRSHDRRRPISRALRSCSRECAYRSCCSTRMRSSSRSTWSRSSPTMAGSSVPAAFSCS